MTFWQSRYNPELKLSQQDLLDISEEITQAYAPDNSQLQSELVLMPVDPITLYAYWNLELGNQPDRQLIMKVYSNPELSEHSSSLNLSFDIKVSSFQGQQKIYLPIAATAYSAVIGEINADNSFRALVTSNIIQVPRETPVVMSEVVPIIDSESSIGTNAEADHSHVVWQEAMPEHNINNSEQPTQKIPMFDHLFVAEINNVPDIIHVQRENIAFESNNNTAKNQYTSTNNATAPQTEPFILKNFNNQGYDLKVYANNSDSEFAKILARQESGFYISPKKLNTTKLNSSGLGLYL